MIPKRKNILINLLNGIEVKNMVYLTKWAGKYKILSRVRGKKINFYPHKGEYFIITQPLGEV